MLNNYGNPKPLSHTHNTHTQNTHKTHIHKVSLSHTHTTLSLSYTHTHIHFCSLRMDAEAVEAEGTMAQGKNVDATDKTPDVICALKKKDDP